MFYFKLVDNHSFMSCFLVFHETSLVSLSKGCARAYDSLAKTDNLKDVLWKNWFYFEKKSRVFNKEFVDF